ncbi:M56 family metallopeptidase [Tumidithrix helvetica PCC 7403]|uniref:M56 family metallopeptidase n=1 Tax=Tumidithrix helvetica TaxID=3457545 RepID=UPI003C9D691E
MHLAMILVVIICAFGLRWSWSTSTGTDCLASWSQRWQRSLILFLLPPLLAIATAISVILMGTQGQMIGLPAGWFSYAIAWGFLIYNFFLLVQLIVTGWRSLHKIDTYAQVELGGQSVRILELSTMFAAQIGFWQPQLVVSQGLLENLDEPHLKAVIQHEQAHLHYRDTFWFFWLGCIRQITFWLPNTQAIWEELLILRELRADRWAAQSVDTLLLAESILWLVCDKTDSVEIFSAALSRWTTRDRLEERIEALLNQPEAPAQMHSWSFAWLLLAFLPLISVYFHS